MSTSKPVRNIGKLSDFFEEAPCETCGWHSSKRNQKELVITGPAKGDLFGLSASNIHVVSQQLKDILGPVAPDSVEFRSVAPVHGYQKTPLWEIVVHGDRILPVGNAEMKTEDAEAWLCSQCRLGVIYYNARKPFEIFLSSSQVQSMQGSWNELAIGPLIVNQAVHDQVSSSISPSSLDLEPIEVLSESDSIPIEDVAEIR